MTPIPPIRSRSAALPVAAFGALLLAAPTHAQTNSANTAAPQTIPGLDNFSIAPKDRLAQPQVAPTPTPSPSPAPARPVTPQPRPTPLIPRPTIEALPTPTPARSPIITPRTLAPPAARPTAGPARTPVPAPRRAASVAPTPAALPTPVGLPTPAAALPQPTPPAAMPTAGALPPPPAHPRPSPLWIVALIALLILPGAVVAAYFYRRALQTAGARGEAWPGDDDEDELAAEAPAPPRPLGPIPAPLRPASAGRPQLELAFRPRRAGTNVTSAAVDYELIVRNAGQAPAEDVRVGLALVTAGNTHDAELKAFFEAPVDRPIVAPFALAPGESRGVHAMAMLPKGAINVVSVKGRPMFVPMVAVNALYSWEGGTGQTGTSHVVGIEREGEERMRPFWLDVNPRMHEAVTVRPHAVGVVR